VGVFGVVDLHAHFAPGPVLERMGWLDRDGGSARMWVADRWQPVPAELVDPEAFMAATDAAAIAVRAPSLPPFLLRYDLSPAQGLEYSRAMNDGLAAASRQMGGRARMLGTVPLQAPAAAADELRRALGDLGLVGVQIATSVSGKVDLDDAGLAPFWRAADALGALVFVHPHDVAGADRMQAYHLRNLVGNPLETSLAGARLIFGGVLVGYPRARILLAHGGGALPWLAGRLDRGHRVRLECRSAHVPPSALAARMFYDTVLFDPGRVRALVEWIGPSQVVLGTDFPFDMGDPDAVRMVGAALADPRHRHAVLEENAARLLGTRSAVRQMPSRRGGGES
jgi:aminocarboxymuconate-semialdehyde decarboxylase